MDLRFLLSHHRPEHYDRCVRIGGVWLCARCLAMYPPLLLGFVGELLLHGAYPDALAPRPWEAAILALLAVPALVDWIRGRIDPHSGTTASRMITGGLLGLSLGRTLYLNARAPMQAPGFEVIVFLIAAVVLGDLVRYALQEDAPERDREPAARPDETSRTSGEE